MPSATSVSDRANVAASMVAIALVTLLCAAPARAQQYLARQTGDVVELEDTKNKTKVSVLTSVGNIAFEMRVNGHNVFRWPYASLDEFRAKPGFNGNPFLGPWANRLDEQAFYANGRKYSFDMQLGNVRGAIPIHGLLTHAREWKVVEVKADGSSARITSRLEFFRNPMWMKQWPFAHTIDMTYALQDGVLQVATKIQNMSNDPMPVAIGFHPYFQLTDSVRDEWTISVGAKTQWVLAQFLPTGETQPIESFFPNPKAIPLKDYDLDHVFGDLIRDESGRAVMSVKGKSQQVDVVLGRNYRAMVIYAPKPAAPPAGAAPNPAAAQNRNYICFEPMVGITNAINLAHKGVYKELQTVAPGGTWEESFWIRARGF